MHMHDVPHTEHVGSWWYNAWQLIQESLNVLWEIEYMSLLTTLAAMLSICTDDWASTGYKHFFYLTHPLQAGWHSSFLHIIL